MSLNYDCVRDILFYLDENFVLRESGKPNPIKLLFVLDEYPLNKYQRDDIFIATTYLLDKGLIVPTSPTASPKVVKIKNITPLGYDFIAAVKNEKVWNKVKKDTKDLARFTIHQLISLGLTYASQG